MSKHQLIVTILGTDKSGILSEIASTVSEAQCNILDSRQAIYGREFSLTMIIEGTQSAITKAECILPALFQRLDLLSMMKRTSHHEKQNLEHLFNVEFSGEDAAGLIKSVTGFFAERHAMISAFRQRTFKDKVTGKDNMRCKFVVSLPASDNLDALESDLMALFATLNVTGKVVDKQKKDPNENVTGW
ncbi:glycine cleavage system transcriptional repressor [Alteromonas sp. McT4-15]|jgi:glycine cleavage system transcriptional repressor|uniref:glycine cleavage system protein R n=1 Tax=Alteromonas sp. McT4-15 TaxID=2881256 RepID=UPI0012E63044|nr:glycine cleavage system transcriptional repressor [Alteromonas sp. McT4-15]MCB4437185.1 glycine cleavage system transcriptional repressor [Alteromonas sp. McT4-15]GFD88869.1 glycine cleavage system transcriptional regulator [Tenacibaculum sp. KUL152]